VAAAEEASHLEVDIGEATEVVAVDSRHTEREKGILHGAIGHDMIERGLV
jgi:hypothetical protein